MRFAQPCAVAWLMFLETLGDLKRVSEMLLLERSRKIPRWQL